MGKIANAGIIKDHVSPESFEKYAYAVACEDCTHFDFATEKCTFDYPTAPFLRRQQQMDLEKTGMIAFCRAQEID